jgi:hypothetical protein
VSKAEHRLPSRTRSMVIAALAFALCALGFGVASATAEAPEVTTPVASEISYDTVHVSGQVDRKDNEYVEWFYEVSTDGSNWERPQGIVSGALTDGSGLQTAAADLEGLKAGATYQVRLVANNFNGLVYSPEPNPEFTTKSLSAPTVAIDPVTTFAGTTATFTGTIDPNPPAGNPPAADVHWHFECTPGCPNVESGTVPAGATGSAQEVEAEATGLEANTTYEVTLVGANAGGSASDGPVEFTTDEIGPDAQTLPAFVLEGGTSALLGARINPHNSPTKYWFVLEGLVGGPVAIPATEDASAGNGGSAQFVTQKALNLSTGTTYHFHVVATSTGGTSEGASVPFTTPTPSPAEGECPNKQFRIGPSASLPDCRAFELVSAPDLGGYSVLHPFTNVANFGEAFPAVAGDGNAAIWATDGIRPDTDSDGNWDNYRSLRTPEGWRSEYVSPPASKRAAEPFIAWADPNLERLDWDVASESVDPTDPDIGLVSPPTSSGGTNSSSYRDLLRQEPDGQFVRLTKGPAEERATSESQFFFPPLFSKDAMRTAFAWRGPKLTAHAEPGAAYVSDGQTTTPINDPYHEGIIPQAISDDGETIVYGTDFGKYLKIVTDGLTRTIIVSEVESAQGGGYKTWHLSGDGKSLLYATPLQETSDDTDTSVDLFEYDVETETKHRISAPTGAPTGPNSGNSDECSGSWSGSCYPFVVAVTRDGSGIYFVSPELLDAELGVRGEPNLYYRSAGVTTYVGSMASGDDGKAFDGRDPTAGPKGLGANHAQLTPDQSKLIFQSKARLTAYDSHGTNEIYLYDPAKGELTCVSCRLNGTQPTGEADMRLHDSFEFRAPLKPLSIVASDDSGEHIFFATYDSLRPGDDDQRSDVYSADLQHGTVSPLGNLPEDQNSYFWGASANGRDVFILSTSRLNEEERSAGAYKLWDARIGGGFAPPPPPVGETCEGDPCHSAGSEGTEAAGSGTSKFEGPANPPVKHKKKNKKHKKHHKHKNRHGKGKKHSAKHRGDNMGRNH